MPKKSATRRQWTPAQKQKILAEAKANGVAAAAKKFKVTESSIYSWRSQSSKPAATAAPKARKTQTRKRRRMKTRDVTAEMAEATARRLAHENSELRGLVVEQLLEIKRLRK